MERTISILTIKPNPQNPRVIRDDAFLRLVDSIKRDPEFLSKRGIVHADGVILGGNQRFRAIQEALKDAAFRERVGVKSQTEIPAAWVQDASEWGEEQRQRFILIDNSPSGLAGDWDFNALKSWNTNTLNAAGFEDINFGGDDENADAEPQINRADELQKEWKTAAGQLWVLGEHRLLCGDSTKQDDVVRVMRGEPAELMVTDPPYGVSYSSKNEFLNRLDKGNRIQTPIANDNVTPDEVDKLWRGVFSVWRPVMGKGACYYVTGPQGGDLLLLLLALRDTGWPLRHMLIWAKNNHVLGRCDYNYKHEPIIYGWVDGGHKFYAKHDVSLWEINKPNKSELHPTTKPVELFARAINNSSVKAGVVVDPFGGAGTTIIACQQLGRKCRSIEITPGYVAVTLQRFKDAFGINPKLVEDGRGGK